MLEISLRQLETFVVTAECGSFTRAAEKLHLTQSTVSTHIQCLEQELRTQLILRGARRRFELTDDGRRVYEASREILSRCEELEKMGESAVASPLSIATSTVPAQQLLPKLMSGFLKKNSNVRFALRRGDSDKVRTMLERGEARIGLMGAAPESHRFVSHVIAHDRLVLISENDQKFRGLKQAGATGVQLIGNPMIAREESSGTQQAVEAYFMGCGIDAGKLNIIARMDNPEAIKAGVEQGMGISVISYLAVQEEVASGRLIAFDLDEKKAYRNIYIAWHKDTALSALEQHFVSYVRSETPKLVK